MSDKKQYIVLDILRHDGVRYEAGGIVALTDEQAAALLPVNVVRLSPNQTPAGVQSDPAGENPPPQEPPEPENLGADLKVADIKTKLDAAGIAYPPGATKPTLLALLPAEG